MSPMLCDRPNGDKLFGAGVILTVETLASTNQ
jgi:hypothetical protein